MSHQSGIEATQEVKDAFGSLQNDESIRAVKIVIENGAFRPFFRLVCIVGGFRPQQFVKIRSWVQSQHPRQGLCPC